MTWTFVVDQPRPDNSALARPFRWTDDLCAKLRELYGHYSASQIAAKIGAPSRNSVIGKAQRLGLMSPSGPRFNPSPRRPRGDTGGGAVTAINARRRSNGLHLNAPRPRVELTTSSVEPDDSRPCLFPELAWGRCRFPIDRLGQRFYCGAPWRAKTDRQSYYCEFHHRATHQPIDRSKRGSTFWFTR